MSGYDVTPAEMIVAIAAGKQRKARCVLLEKQLQGYHCRPDVRDQCLAHDLAVELEKALHKPTLSNFGIERLRTRVAELESHIVDRRVRE